MSTGDKITTTKNVNTVSTVDSVLTSKSKKFTLSLVWSLYNIKFAFYHSLPITLF